jgi:hypothetical protein
VNTFNFNILKEFCILHSAFCILLASITFEITKQTKVCQKPPSNLQPIILLNDCFRNLYIYTSHNTKVFYYKNLEFVSIVIHISLYYFESFNFCRSQKTIKNFATRVDSFFYFDIVSENLGSHKNH